jgi:hypothetical protein
MSGDEPSLPDDLPPLVTLDARRRPAVEEFFKE